MQKRKTATKLELTSALVTLLATKDYDQITVRDITQAAGINRSTFYAHYTDKNDMITQLIQSMLTDLMQLLPEQGTQEAYLAPLTRIFEYLEANMPLLYGLTEKNFTYIDQLLRDFLSTLIERIEPLRSFMETQTNLPKDYAREIFLYSNAAIVIHWIRKGGQEPPAQIAQLLYQNNLHL